LSKRFLAKKALLCFDLDGTLYPGNTSMAFYRYMLKTKSISWKTWPYAVIAYLSYRFSCKNITLLHHFVHKWVLSKLASNKILNLVPDFIKQVVLPNIRKRLIDQIEHAREKGHQIALLSSSPDFIVNEIAKMLKINLILASTYPISHTGYFTSDIQVIRGHNKATWIEHFLQKEPSFNFVYAYSDALEDLPMLLKADVKCAVFPEQSLHRLSIEKGWQLIN
jgi:HAD superfamily hydrolase (TIGR01490 family)